MCEDCQLLNIIYQIFSLADRHKIVRLPWQETVEILEYDQDNAALLDNLHSEVIVYSDRPLTSGGRVRKDG